MSRIGALKWYSITKGYGFVMSEAGDVMIHAHALQNRESDMHPFRVAVMMKTPISVVYEFDESHPRLRAQWWRPIY